MERSGFFRTWKLNFNIVFFTAQKIVCEVRKQKHTLSLILSRKKLDKIVKDVRNQNGAAKTYTCFKRAGYPP